MISQLHHKSQLTNPNIFSVHKSLTTIASINQKSMASNPNIIDLSSDSSESLMSPSPLRMPTQPRGLTKEQAKKRKHDVPLPANSSSSSSSLPPYPAEIDDPEYQREMERQWNAMERAKRVPTPEESSSHITSSDEEDDGDDPLYNPKIPEKPQSSCP